MIFTVLPLWGPPEGTQNLIDALTHLTVDAVSVRTDAKI